MTELTAVLLKDSIQFCLNLILLLLLATFLLLICKNKYIIVTDTGARVYNDTGIIITDTSVRVCNKYIAYLF